MKKNYGWPIPEEEIEKYRHYHTVIKKYIFQRRHQREQYISQDASVNSIHYHDGIGYLGILKTSSDSDLGKRIQRVATHFEDKMYK